MNTKKSNFITVKLLLIVLLTFNFQLLTYNVFSQNIGISSTGATPNEKAMLDLDASPNNNTGLPIPRLTTANRDAIAAPIPLSLLIFNTTTQCFEAWNGTAWVAFGCIGFIAPTGVTASAAPSPICEGSNLSLTGSATGATAWSWTGPNGFTSAAQNPTITGITTAAAGVYTLTASNSFGWSEGVSTASVVVKAPPTTATNNSTQSICSTTNTVTLSGNNPSVGTGAWTVVSGPSTLSSQFANVSVHNTTFTPATSGAGSYVLRWTISNSPCNPSYANATITVKAPPTVANAGSDINLACNATTATLAGNSPTIGTGEWSVVSGTATITTPSSPPSGVTGLAVPSTAKLRWTISNSPCTPSIDDVVITTTVCGPCVGVTAPSGYGIVESSGKCWLDRNLGASQVATSSIDASAYGDLYQWGRATDGHQKITSETTSTFSTTDNPEHSKFILSTDATNVNNDWRSPQNNNLWQGVNGTNNPCPSGWRLPTRAEWEVESSSWGVPQNSAGAYASPLKLSVAGLRNYGDGTLSWRGSNGYYWSSTLGTAQVDPPDYEFYSERLFIYSGGVRNNQPNRRAYGYSVRCIKD